MVAVTRFLLVLLLSLGACRPGGDAIIVAVGDQRLPASAVATLASNAPASLDQRLAFRAVAEAWLDYALMAEAARLGWSGRDTGLIRESLAPLVQRETIGRLRNQLAGERPAVTEADLSRVYAGDSLRLFQSVVLLVNDWGDPDRLLAKVTRIDSIRILAARGAPFYNLAQQFSETVGALYGGIGSVVTRERIPEADREQLWRLPPGGMSPVLRTRLGLELVRRPPLAEVRAAFAAGLLMGRGIQADSVLADSLAVARGLRILPETADRFRQVLFNPDSLGPDSALVVGFQGGGLSPTAAWSWVAGLPDPVRLKLAWSSPADLERAAVEVARSHLLAEVAATRGIVVSDRDLRGLRTAFGREVDAGLAWFAPNRAGGPVSADSLVARALRGEAAVTIPAGLAAALRRRIPHGYNAVGIGWIKSPS